MHVEFTSHGEAWEKASQFQKRIKELESELASMREGVQRIYDNPAYAQPWAEGLLKISSGKALLDRLQAVEAERDRYRTALEKQLKRAKRPKHPKGPKIHIILDGKSTMIDCNDQWIAHGSDVRAALPFDQMRHTILREGNPDEVITDTMPVYTGDKLHTIPPCYGS